MYERMELQDRSPVPGGRATAERPSDGLGQAALEDAPRAPHVGDAPAEGQGIRSPVLLEQRLKPGSICRIAQDSDEQARGIVGNPEHGVLDNNAGKLRGGQHRYSSGDSELLRQGLLDAGRGVARGSGRGAENHIAAIQQGAHVAVAQALDQRAQVCHRHALGASNVDSAEKGDMPGGRHVIALPASRRQGRSRHGGSPTLIGPRTRKRIAQAFKIGKDKGAAASVDVLAKPPREQLGIPFSPFIPAERAWPASSLHALSCRGMPIRCVFTARTLLSWHADPLYTDVMSETATLDTESEILEQVIESDTAGMSPEAAQALLRFRFNTAAVARMNELAEKNRQGTIAPSERALLERYLRVGNFLNLIHAKARCALAEPASPAS